MSLLMGAAMTGIAVGGCVGVAFVAAWVQQRAEAWATEGIEPPDQADDEPDEPDRDSQIEAVQALCYSTPAYVAARLAPYEIELAPYAELVLELDDQAPKPTGPAED